MNSTVLVLGATGKIGRRLIPALVSSGVAARPASRKPLKDFVVFDWGKPETYAPALAGVEALYLVPPEQVEDPSEQVDELFRSASASGVRKLVLVSSLGVAFPSEPSHSGRLKVERLAQNSPFNWTILRPGGFSQNFPKASSCQA